MVLELFLWDKTHLFMWQRHVLWDTRYRISWGPFFGTNITSPNGPNKLSPNLWHFFGPPDKVGHWSRIKSDNWFSAWFIFFSQTYRWYILPPHTKLYTYRVITVSSGYILTIYRYGKIHEKLLPYRKINRKILHSGIAENEKNIKLTDSKGKKRETMEGFF